MKKPKRRGGIFLWRALGYTVVLRVIYALYALLLRGHLTADPRLVRGNDFVDHLISPDQPLRYALLGVWERFDTLWYIHIAQHGYDRQAAVVFYPLYPLLIRVVSLVVHPPLAAALLVSTFATFCFAWGLQKLINLDLPDSAAARALLLLAFWPASFILFAGYADSLVMAFSVWSIYFARTNRWRLAALTGLFAGFTKAVGALAAVPLAWLAWRNDRSRLAASAVPLAAPAAFTLWIRQSGYGSAAAAYEAHWRTHVAWPWTTMARSFHAFFAHPPNLLVLRMNVIFLLLACGLVLVRGLRLEYRLYAYAMLAMFLTKSTDPLLQSTMRYVLAVFPALIALTMLLEKRPLGLALLCAFFGLVNAVLVYEFWRWSMLV